MIATVVPFSSKNGLARQCGRGLHMQKNLVRCVCVKPAYFLEKNNESVSVWSVVCGVGVVRFSARAICAFHPEFPVCQLR